MSFRKKRDTSIFPNKNTEYGSINSLLKNEVIHLFDFLIFFSAYFEELFDKIQWIQINKLLV